MKNNNNENSFSFTTKTQRKKTLGKYRNVVIQKREINFNKYYVHSFHFLYFLRIPWYFLFLSTSFKNFFKKE